MCLAFGGARGRVALRKRRRRKDPLHQCFREKKRGESLTVAPRPLLSFPILTRRRMAARNAVWKGQLTPLVSAFCREKGLLVRFRHSKEALARNCRANKVFQILMQSTWFYVNVRDAAFAVSVFFVPLLIKWKMSRHSTRHTMYISG